MAYARASQTGVLRDVRVLGELVVSRLLEASRSDSVVLARVHADSLRFTAEKSSKGLRIESSKFDSIRAAGARFDGPLSIVDSTVGSLLQLSAADLAGLVISDSQVANAVFTGTTFRGPLELYRSTFGAPTGFSCTSFDDARFHSTVRLDKSEFVRDLSMRSAVIAADATFIRTQVRGIADFSNVNFRGDAEFRYCDFGPTTFGGPDAMAAFAGLADFRGCKLASARFDFAEFRGDALWTDVKVAGDMSLRNSALHGEHSDFFGLHVAGALSLENSYLGKLQLHWRSIEGAVMRASPTSRTLWNLYQQLSQRGDRADRQHAFFAASQREFSERVGSPSSKLHEVLLAYAEHVAWGWPTAYGTDLARILTLAGMVWLGCSLVLWYLVIRSRGLGARPRILELATSPNMPKISDVVNLPQAEISGRVATLLHFLRYTFCLMFAPWSSIRISRVMSVGARRMLRGSQVVGAGLWLLIVLTLRSTSPALEALLGAVDVHGR